MANATRVNEFLLDEQQRVDVDLPCVGCTYNLRTCHRDANCPECGRPVVDSLLMSVFTLKAKYRWLRRAATGMITLGIGLAVPGLILIVWPIAALLLWPEPDSKRRLNWRSPHVGLLLSLVGWILLAIWSGLDAAYLIPRPLSRFLWQHSIILFLVWMLLITLTATSWTLLVNRYARQVRCKAAIRLANIAWISLVLGQVALTTLLWMTDSSRAMWMELLVLLPLMVAYLLSVIQLIYLGIAIHTFVKVRTVAEVFYE